MSLERMEVIGFRGFNSLKGMNFAIPNGQPGSGLTFITGSNNSGKSTILECFRARMGHGTPSFSVGTRNTSVDMVDIKFFIGGKQERIRSIKKGSSEAVRDNVDHNFGIFVLPSRRGFAAFFNKGDRSREMHIQTFGLDARRPSSHEGLAHRLFTAFANPDKFNEMLYRVLPARPEWALDQSDEGNYFLKFYNGIYSHNSDGMGEGLISVFAIVDSLYDSLPSNLIVIDEPELSLHPSLQKRVFSLLKDLSSTRQIVIATHSPYFVDIESIANGAALARVTNQGGGIEIFEISGSTRASLNKIGAKDRFNPHTLGLNARELFFQEDGIIVVEGQDDIVFFPEICAQLGLDLNGAFFGWGAGGAHKFEHVCAILNDLGFKKVVGILDNDKRDGIPDLERQFPQYHFFSIAADDIRDKDANPSPAKSGLLDSKRRLKPEFEEQTRELILNVNNHLK